MNDFFKVSKTKIILLFLLFNLSNAYSQIKLDTSKVEQFANEVYKNCMQYATPEYFEGYKRKLRSIDIFKKSDLEKTNIEYHNLNSVVLKNKCNNNLQYDNASNFTPENFNPLKYFFLMSYEPVYYKIEGVEYVIKVTTNY